MKYFIIIVIIVLASFSFMNNIVKNDNKRLIVVEDSIGYLEIEDINLKEYIYPKDSHKNSVDYGIEILESSNDKIIYLAGHSGMSVIAIFNDLIKLDLGSKVFLKYQDQGYSFSLRRREFHDKNGYLNLNIENTKLVLITCYKSDKQLVLFYS